MVHGGNADHPVVLRIAKWHPVSQAHGVAAVWIDRDLERIQPTSAISREDFTYPWTVALRIEWREEGEPQHGQRPRTINLTEGDVASLEITRLTNKALRELTLQPIYTEGNEHEDVLYHNSTCDIADTSRSRRGRQASNPSVSHGYV